MMEEKSFINVHNFEKLFLIDFKQDSETSQHNLKSVDSSHMESDLRQKKEKKDTSNIRKLTPPPLDTSIV